MKALNNLVFAVAVALVAPQVQAGVNEANRQAARADGQVALQAVRQAVWQELNVNIRAATPFSGDQRQTRFGVDGVRFEDVARWGDAGQTAWRRDAGS